MAGFDVDAWLDSYQPRTSTVAVGLDMTLVAEHQRLDSELRAALLESSPDEKRCLDLARRIVALEADIEGSGKVFSLQAVSHEGWADLMREHPPTDEQLAKQKLLDHNPDTFPPAAIAACAVEPALTVTQATRARKTLGNADFHTLWEAVLMLNREVAAAPKSQLAGVVLQASKGSPASSARKASHGRSSSAANAARSRRTTTRKGK